MVLIALKCPHCGGDIQLDDSREFGFCLYCGTKIAVRDEVVNQINDYHGDAGVRNVYNGRTTVTGSKGPGRIRIQTVAAGTTTGTGTTSTETGGVARWSDTDRSTP